MSQEIKITAEVMDGRKCRFNVDRPVYEGGSLYFSGRERAEGSPLVESLFEISGIETVLITKNLVTITKKSDEDWAPVAKQAGAAIRRHLQSGGPVVAPDVESRVPSSEEIKNKVQRVLSEEINPAVASHGGFIHLIDVKDNVVFIQMGGGCQGCGMANVTLKQGVEHAIREAVPEVGEIMDVTDHASGQNPYYRPSKEAI